MRVILHIGQQKTGSTAIQEALRRDRERLRSLGVLFPDTGHDAGLRGHKHANHNGLFLALHRGESFTQTFEQIRTELAEQVSEAEPETILISAEAAFMAADLRKGRPLDRLDEMLPGDKQVVVYLRRPDRYVSSMHQQMIRNGNTIAALDSPERIERLTKTCQLDYVRAVREYGGRYGAVQAFRYESVGDTVDHFYATVLGLEPPSERPQRPNTSIPAVMVDLARQHTNKHGRMNWHQAQALVRHGHRERVDLLGAANRQRLFELFEEQNAELGRLIDSDVFFDDISDMTTVPDGAITPDEANERYRGIFETLVRLPTVYDVRRSCLDLENRGRFWAAGQLFAAQSKHLSEDDIGWFRRDLEAATSGRYSIVDGRYEEVQPEQPDPVIADDNPEGTPPDEPPQAPNRSHPSTRVLPGLRAAARRIAKRDR